MRILVTGSAGHLGEALMRTFEGSEHEAIGLDLKQSAWTQLVGSVADRRFVQHALRQVDVVLHAATLHKPHIATHGKQDFIDTNITGTLNLLEAAVAAGVRSFVYTSTTSTFGHALRPAADQPAAWITEQVVPVPRNIYGVTKLAAESLCELFHRHSGMPCIILKTSRFFPEEDDDGEARRAFERANLKVNEFLYRRADIEDIVAAHLLAMDKAARIGFGRYIISATSPFTPDDLRELRMNAPAVVSRYVPGYEEEYRGRGWSMLPSIDRVYVNELARVQLGWRPKYDFGYVLEKLRAAEDFRSPLARLVGSKGYHDRTFAEGPYPVHDHSHR